MADTEHFDTANCWAGPKHLADTVRRLDES